MNIIDKRVGRWNIAISSEDCPFLTYPRSDVACELLEGRPGSSKPGADTYCCLKNCPRKETIK